MPPKNDMCRCSTNKNQHKNGASATTSTAARSPTENAACAATKGCKSLRLQKPRRCAVRPAQLGRGQPQTKGAARRAARRARRAARRSPPHRRRRREVRSAEQRRAEGPEPIPEGAATRVKPAKGGWEGVLGRCCSARPKQMWICSRWRSQLNKSTICCRSVQNNTGPAEASETEAKAGREAPRKTTARRAQNTNRRLRRRPAPPGAGPGGAPAEEPPGGGEADRAVVERRPAAAMPPAPQPPSCAPVPPPAGTSRSTWRRTSSAP